MTKKYGKSPVEDFMEDVAKLKEFQEKIAAAPDPIFDMPDDPEQANVVRLMEELRASVRPAEGVKFNVATHLLEKVEEVLLERHRNAIRMTKRISDLCQRNDELVDELAETEYRERLAADKHLDQAKRFAVEQAVLRDRVVELEGGGDSAEVHEWKQRYDRLMNVVDRLSS